MNRKTAKTKVLDSFVSISLFKFGTSLPLNFVFYLICDLLVNETSPTGLLKGYMFLLVLVEIWFLRRNLGSTRRNSGQVSSYAGESKGGQASPFVSLWVGDF